MKEKISQYIENKNMDELKTMLSKAEELEILYAFIDLSAEEQVIVFRLLAKDTALSIFEDLDTDLQRNLLQSFTNESTIELVNEMAPDDRVKLFDELPATVTKKLIESLSHEERETTNILIGYKPETAGRIMTTEYISLKKDMKAAQALEKVLKQAKEKETIYILFVTDNAKKLEGVLSLKELLVADGDCIIEDIMSKKTISVSTDTDQEEVAATLQELDLLAIPVVDSENRMVGIVTVDDAMDVVRDEATEDIYKQAGLDSLKSSENTRSETLIKGNFWQIWRVRLPIIALVLVWGFLAGLIVEGFEGILESMTAIAFFIPLIMNMGGSVGGQSTTIFARGYVLGHIKAGEFWRQILKEAMVGFSIGSIVGFFAFFVVWAWLGEPLVALSVALALAINCLVAASAGFLVPYFLIKIGADQAAGSGPIITSIKDITGLLVYFFFVTLFLGHLL
ncbi:MAG: magnesium transporter [Defluviitaleaceae bacterium]|nr:magnesium transporter [Defluviitaleaceae bacterium]